MKVTRDQVSSLTVRRIAPGEIVIGNETVRDNVVLTTEQDIERWAVDDVSRFAAEDFAAIIDSRPEIVVLGTGWHPVLPPKEIVFAMAREGIGFESMNTPAACRTFNILINEGRRTAAVLIVNDGSVTAREKPAPPAASSESNAGGEKY